MFFKSGSMLLAMASAVSARYVMYLTGQHNIIPTTPSLLSGLTHVNLAFMRSDIFNSPSPPTSWPLFTTVDKVRSQLPPGVKVLIAIGGWGDTGFSHAAGTEEGRERFAKNIKAMLESTGADGVDIDWEYPGGNGEDYLLVPNFLREWEIDAFPELLSAIRKTLSPSKLITAAVPGHPRDMLAFTTTTTPPIMSSLDFLNVMTYDLINRRDTKTSHHAGIQVSLRGLDAYERLGVKGEDMNLGFAFYVRWYKTAKDRGCEKDAIGCETEIMEDPDTGKDLGKAGAFSWHDPIPCELTTSFEKALKGGKWDDIGGGHYFWDEEEDLFWSWETEEGIKRKFRSVVKDKGLGGVFAWGLGEDADGFGHLEALTKEVERYWVEKGEERVGKDEL